MNDLAQPWPLLWSRYVASWHMSHPLTTPLSLTQVGEAEKKKQRQERFGMKVTELTIQVRLVSSLVKLE